MYKIGLSSDGRAITENFMAECQKAGIEAVEVAMRPDTYLTADFKANARWAEQYGIELWSLHLPIAPQEHYDVSNKFATVEAMAYQTELIKRACETMGIKHFVIHSGGEPIREEDREDIIKLAGEKLSILADLTAQYGANMCIEVLPRTCLGRDSDEILAMLAYDDRLRVCFDVNHVFRESEVDFVRKIGSKIATTHISDRDNINERHWLPGEGVLDWNAILDVLNEVGYNGVWMYEIGFGIPKTILRDRELTCADFTRNAREVFARQKPTVISRPKENVGMWE